MSRAGVGVVVALLALALSPVATAQHTQGARPAALGHAAHERGEPPQRVLLHVRMPDCKACKIKLMTVLNDQFDTWESRWKGVRHGEISFDISARHARGATFLIKARWADLYGYQPLVAFHYRGFDDGDQVSNAQAAKQKRGTACWVGGRGRESLTVWTGRFKGQTPPGDDATGIRAWVSHTQPKLGRYLLAYKGSVGTQDIVPCGNH